MVPGNEVKEQRVDLDAFQVHRQLIDDYRSFTEGFVDIRDPRPSDAFKEQSLEGAQWPDPWLSLNPSFAAGRTQSTELVGEGLLDPRCCAVFSSKRPGETADAVLALPAPA